MPPHRFSRELCKPKRGQLLTLDSETYRLGNEIGSGATGVVRLATRSRDSQKLAIKFFAPDPKYVDADHFEDLASRFRREGQRAQLLRHASLLTIYNYSDNKGARAFHRREVSNPFLVMEHVRGDTLETEIARLSGVNEVLDYPSPFSRNYEVLVTPRKLSLALCVLDALELLAQKRLTHRDVKPANIFIPQTSRTDGPRAILGDFGIMKWGDFQASLATGSLTATAQQGLGTMKYMAPEQAKNPKAVGVRADMYSLGITLMELFTEQIFGSYHHVYDFIGALSRRGPISKKLHSIDCGVKPEDEAVAALVLEMFNQDPNRRPSAADAKRRLAWEYESRTGNEWTG